MANSTADGSVVIEVDMNVSDAEKELTRLKTRVFKLEDEIGEKESRRNDLVERRRQITAEINELQKNRKILDGDSFADTSAIDEKISHMRGEVSGINKEIGTLDTSLDGLNSRLEFTKMRFGEVSEIAKTLTKEFDESTISGRLEKASYELAQLSAQGKGLGNQEYDEAYRKLALLTNEAREYQKELAKTPEQAKREADAIRAAQEAEQRLLDIKENAAVSDQHMIDLNEELVRLKARQAELQQAGVGLGHQEYDGILQRLREINVEIKCYEDGLLQVEKNTGKSVLKTDAAKKSMSRLGKRIRSLAASALVFNVISRALTSLQQMVMKYVKTNDEARQAIAQLKGALLTLAQPLIEIIIPAFTAFVNVLAKVVNAIAALLSKLFGKSYDQTRKNAKALYEEQKALTATGNAAEDAAGQLAGFDEINQLDTSSETGGGGAGGEIAPDFSAFIGGELDKVTELVGAALLAIGAILTFSGVNIPLGISLMALGATALASVITENWDAISEKLKGPLGIVVALISGALLALGAILLFSDAHVGLGLGLMVAGAMGMATVIAANWDTIKNALQGPIGVLVGILSGALLVIGGVLAFSGANLPLGLALMALGAAGMATVIAANWDTIKNALEGPVGYIVLLISGALLMLGAVLAFSGVNLPLGLALLAAGAVGLATSMAANWDTIKNALQGPLGKVVGMISGALLVLGVILAFTGVALPLGLGLIAVGAVGLATSIAANWDALKEKLGGTIETIATIVSAALLVLGVILLFTGAGIPLGLGLIAGGAAILASPIAPKWDNLLNAIKGAWQDVKDWWSNHVAKYFSWDYWFGKGEDSMEGLAAGIEKATKKVKDGLDEVANLGKRVLTTTTISTAAGKKPSISITPYAAIPRLEADQIPRLAQGAVIPANREFLAVLGDQKSGTNVEAPANLIRQMVMEGIQAAGISGGGRPIQVNVMLDKRVLARAMVNEVNDMTRQAGKPVLLI